MFILDWFIANTEEISAFATVAIAASAIATFFITKNLANENKLLRLAGMTPKVVAYLKSDPRKFQAVYLVFANVGQGPATDVRFTLECDEADFENRRPWIMGQSNGLISATLPQGERIETFFGTAIALLAKPEIKPFKVIVRFRDINGNLNTEESELDVAQFKVISKLGKSPEEEIIEALKEIAENTKKPALF